MQRSKRKTTTQSSKLKRIVDANINRAAEGLRVMEEVARFIVEHKAMTEQLKKLRAKLRSLAKRAGDIRQRSSLTDVGGKSYTKSESRRKSLRDVFAANAKRVEEALRVLEEFTKLTDPGLGRSFKTIRFKVYDLEKRGYQALDRCA